MHSESRKTELQILIFKSNDKIDCINFMMKSSYAATTTTTTTVVESEINSIIDAIKTKYKVKWMKIRFYS